MAKDMSIGKYISLEEAQKEKKIDRFAKAHPSKGDKKLFDKVLGAMAKKPQSGGQTSGSSRRRED